MKKGQRTAIILAAIGTALLGISLAYTYYGNYQGLKPGSGISII